MLVFYIKIFIFLLFVTLLGKVLFVATYWGYFSNLTNTQIIQALLHGLRFDLAVASLLTLVISLFHLPCFKNKKHTPKTSIILILTIVLILVQTADIIYFSYSSKHISYEVNNVLTDASALAKTAIFSHLDTLVYGSMLGLLSFFILKKISLIITNSKCYQQNLLFLLIFIISIIFIRGGLYAVPMSPIDAYNIGNSKQANIALNGFYSAIYWTIKQEKVEPIKLPVIDQSTLSNSIEFIQKNLDPEPILSKQQDINIVLILLESWSADQIKSYGYDRSTTPFFDKIHQGALTANAMLAGGHRTTEGMLSTLCSIQNPLGQTIAKSSLQDFNYLCLPQILREKGWDTAFFQGSNKNTSGTGSFAQKLGFQLSFGKKEISRFKYEKNNWGVHDFDLYQFVKNKTKSMSEPFLIGINTNTTHDQHLPPNIKPRFGMGNKRDIDDSVLYFADQALEEFITQFETLPLTKPTIFVLVGDHTKGVRSNIFKNAQVAFAIYFPGQQLKKTNIIASQRDISPTILSLLGIPIPSNFSGQSLIFNTKTHFADYYQGGTLGWVENNHMMEINISSNKTICYDYINNQQKPTICKQKENMLKHALSFYTKSQSLLFSGKTNDFKWIK